MWWHLDLMFILENIDPPINSFSNSSTNGIENLYLIISLLRVL